MCECCNEARDWPGNYQFFADGCLHCAARHIQYIQRRLNLASSVKADRCRQALATALTFGLSEADIRRMAKSPDWQLAPELQKKKAK